MAVDGNMSDWTTDAANAIDNAVGIVRERTGNRSADCSTRPVFMADR